MNKTTIYEIKKKKKHSKVLSVVEWCETLLNYSVAIK